MKRVGLNLREPILCVGTVNPLGTKCLGSHYQCVSETFVCYVVEVRGTTVEMWLFFLSTSFGANKILMSNIM